MKAKIKIIKEDDKIMIFVNDNQIPYISKISFERNEDIKYLDVTLKILANDIEFIDKTKEKE